MHTRRLLTAVLGAWLAGSALTAYIASSNFDHAGQILESKDPKVTRILQILGEKDARQLLRHEASEMNRTNFARWQQVQLFFSLLIIGMLFSTRAKTPSLVVAALLTTATLANYFAVTPHIIGLGALMDFTPSNQFPIERARFAAMHQAYGGLELLKLARAWMLLIAYSRRTGKRRVSGKTLIDEVDEIDDADDRHVNR